MEDVRPVILKYSNVSDNIAYVDKIKRLIDDISLLSNKNGYNFRYPTSYSLEYRFDNKWVDLKNIYKYFKELIDFLNGCDFMLDTID